MKNIRVLRKCPTFLLALTLLCAWGASFSAQHTTAFAAEVTIGIGMALPPYVIKAQDRGLEVEIIRKAFKAAGHTVHFRYLPNLRLPKYLKQRKIDGIAANAAYDIGKDTGLTVYPSDTTLVYQNFAIALKRKELHVQSIADLAGKQVLAFQNATRYLGQEFAQMAASNARYEEQAQQAIQVNRLYKKRTDVVVSDKRIFLYWRDAACQKKLLTPSEAAQELTFFPIFPQAPRNCTLIDETLRDDLNKGLRIIRENGIYEGISETYNSSDKK